MKKCTMLIVFLCAFAGIGIYAQEPIPKTPGALIKGRVLNEKGAPLDGAGVAITQTSVGTSTDKDGNFQLKVPTTVKSLTISFVGYTTQIIALTGKNEYVVHLQVENKAMGDVVVTGIFTRKKESFTGAVASFKGEELKAVGNQNVIQSLKTLDPSFILIENAVSGSNPNVLPTIEVRGKTSIRTTTDQFANDPNQPLFILDGFETTLRVINDLDINRIASATILKDAASTALYGAKAANGVVVIETKKPLPGELRVNYSGDFRVEIPDLSSYNMMNAAEKLEFERLAGKYQASTWTEYAYQMEMDKKYFRRLGEVQRGINTYWLSEPVRTGFTNGHSLQISGGSNELQFVAGVQYRNLTGAMKGSGRKTWGSNIDLTYRKGSVNVSNRLSIRGFNSTESPYGSFTDFVNVNPYYQKRNTEGEIDKFLEKNVTNSANFPGPNVPNPLYNASLNSHNGANNIAITNNLQVIWTINNDLRLQAGLQVEKGITTNTVFTPPENTRYEEVSVYEKGEYANGRADNSGYQGNVMLTYAKVLNVKHQFTSNLRAEIQETNNSNISVWAVGFPFGSTGNPAFAFSYKPDAAPGAAVSLYRRNNVLASINYSFDRRFMFDVTYRIDGSTAFGSAKKYSPFWSTGIGWNLHNEKFLKNTEWINLLKVRANIGITGNQGVGSTASTSIYNYANGSNLFGQGLLMSALKNENLKWQKTLQTSVGADFSILNNRVSATVNMYVKRTDPLVIAVNQAASTGVKAYPMNLGYMNTTGKELMLKVSPVYDLQNRIIWTLSAFGSTLKNTLGGFNNTLESLNKQQQLSKSLIRYKDGHSPDDLWAVRSLGIDPANGQEVFQKVNGQTSYLYDAEDIVMVGNSRPTMEGVLGTNLVYKGLTVGVNIRYTWGGNLFNGDLFNRVENISYSGLNKNQDKRALYDRWKKEGDVTQFKSISMSSTTPMSSRFLQKNNYIAGESITVGWEFLSDSWIKHAKMQSLRINAYANDIFRAASIKLERGTGYPFTRSVSLSINATF